MRAASHCIAKHEDNDDKISSHFTLDRYHNATKNVVINSIRDVHKQSGDQQLPQWRVNMQTKLADNFKYNGQAPLDVFISHSPPIPVAQLKKPMRNAYNNTMHHMSVALHFCVPLTTLCLPENFKLLTIFTQSWYNHDTPATPMIKCLNCSVVVS